MAVATSPNETVRTLHRQLTTAIWREALAIKANRATTAHLAGTQREEASDRLLRLADRWGDDQRPAPV